MKRFFTILCSVFFLFTFSTLNAQSNQELKLDSRAENYYQSKDIEKMKLVAPWKILQINYLYSQSFRIINQDGNPVKTDASKFDVYNYERFRKQSEKAVFRLTREGDALELLSRDEVDEAYLKIQNSYTPN